MSVLSKRIRRLAGAAVLASAALAMVSFAGTTGSRAAELGDPDLGLAYAKRVCAECHGVLPGSKGSPVSAATPFRVFANTPGLNRRAMIVFLQTPHPTMPNLIVTGDDADNIIAYILSLKTK